MKPCTQPRSRFASRQGRAAPALLVTGALLASGLVFYFFTSKRLAPSPSQASAPAVSTAPDPAASSPTAAPQASAAAPAPTTAAPAKPAPPPEPAKPSFGFARPLDLAKDLAQSLLRQDWTRAGQLATAVASPGSPSPEQAADVFSKIQQLGYKPGALDSVEVLGQIEQFTRLAIPLVNAAGETLRLQIDVERDDTMGWRVTRLRLPPALASSLAALPAAPAPASASASGMSPASTAAAPSSASATAPGQQGSLPVPPPPSASSTAAAAMRPGAPSLFVVEDTLDALTFTDSFVRHLLSHDFVKARQFIDESRIPSERIAGLCIVFEEGQYLLQPGKPLVMTAAGDDAAWVIAQVKSEKLAQQTEFGIELQRQAPDQPWRVIGLNLSDILGSFARSASKLGVPYTPIVKNPKGGESLALYFEYDEAALHPRAQKQLQIVADMLKSDPSRRLRIAGHADALGQEDYNLRLSRQRAESVKQQLVALGVAAPQIDTTGLGTAQPLSPNQKSDGTDDPEGRSKNRRAEIYLDF